MGKWEFRPSSDPQKTESNSYEVSGGEECQRGRAKRRKERERRREKPHTRKHAFMIPPNSLSFWSICHFPLSVSIVRGFFASGILCTFLSPSTSSSSSSLLLPTIIRER